MEQLRGPIRGVPNAEHDPMAWMMKQCGCPALHNPASCQHQHQAAGTPCRGAGLPATSRLPLPGLVLYPGPCTPVLPSCPRYNPVP